MLVGAKGVPGGTPTCVERILVNVCNSFKRVFNNSIVESPNKTDSLAILLPKNTPPPSETGYVLKIMGWVVSKFIDSTEFKFIDFLEDNNKWSSVVLNTNLPEFNIICLPAYWLGAVGLVL